MKFSFHHLPFSTTPFQPSKTVPSASIDSILRWYQVDSASSLLPALKSATSDSPISFGVGPLPLFSFFLRMCLKVGAEDLGLLAFVDSFLA